MADLTVTAANVGMVFPDEAEHFTFIAAATITAGQVVYQTSAGKVNLADANGSGTRQARGIALNGGGAGQAISVLKRGHVSGFALSGVAYDGIAYLSDTAGALADAAGTLRVPVGRCVALADASLTKALYVDCRWVDDWS